MSSVICESLVCVYETQVESIMPGIQMTELILNFETAVSMFQLFNLDENVTQVLSEPVVICERCSRTHNKFLVLTRNGTGHHVTNLSLNC